MNANGHLIESLAQSPVYQKYEDAFTEATGLPVTLRPLETWQLPLHGKRKENAFCALIADKSKSCAACLRLQADLARSAIDESATVTCDGLLMVPLNWSNPLAVEPVSWLRLFTLVEVTPKLIYSVFRLPADS